MTTKVKAIITGSKGMVGEGVLHECLLHSSVESVLVINLKPCGVSNPKLKEIILADFFNLSTIESQLAGYNACFLCAGVSSVGMKEPEYSKITYDQTMIFAQTLCKLNPDMTFRSVSGAGTDSTEKGRMMWARVKGKPIFPGYFGTLKDVGLAMINCALSGYEKKVLEAKDIAGVAKKTQA